MTPDEMVKRFKTAIEDLNLSAEQAAQLAGELARTEKTAPALGIAFKAAPPAYPMGRAIIRDAQGKRLKGAI